MNFTKTLLAAAALTASVGASAAVTGSLGGGFGPFLSLNTSAVDQKCTPSGGAICNLSGNVITSGTIYQADKPFADIPAGGVFESRFLAAGPTSSNPSVLTFGTPTSYLSFLWGSPDLYNSLTITEFGGASKTYTVGSGPGDETLDFSVTNGNQSFSQYVQFVSTLGIVSVSFGSASADAFEAANFSITPIPEPETYALMLAGLAALGFVSKRRKQA